MNRFLLFSLIAVFSIFLGSQITEGALLVPYWKSLTALDFYTYYADFGPKIGRFYTLLTIAAVLIPLGVSVYCFAKKSKALVYALTATIFALLIILLFYVYFKGVNQQFYQAAFTNDELHNVLLKWEFCHWARVVIEFLSLTFLSLTFSKLLKEHSSTPKNP